MWTAECTPTPGTLRKEGAPGRLLYLRLISFRKGAVALVRIQQHGKLISGGHHPAVKIGGHIAAFLVVAQRTAVKILDGLVTVVFLHHRADHPPVKVLDIGFDRHCYPLLPLFFLQRITVFLKT